MIFYLTNRVLLCYNIHKSQLNKKHMKNQKSFRVWGFCLVILSIAFLFINITWYYVDEFFNFLALLPALVGGILLGAGIGVRPQGDLYWLSDIQNGKRFQVINDAWPTPNDDPDGKTILCTFPKKQYFLLFVGKDFYANKEIDGKFFIKHKEKVYAE